MKLRQVVYDTCGKLVSRRALQDKNLHMMKIHLAGQGKLRFLNACNISLQ